MPQKSDNQQTLKGSKYTLNGQNRFQDAHNNSLLETQNLPERKIDSQRPKINFQSQKLTPRGPKSSSGQKLAPTA